MRGLFGAIAAPSAKAVGDTARTLDNLPGFLIGPESKSGVSITWSTALQVTAMLACAKVVGEGVAQARCRLIKQRQGRVGFDPAVAHPLYRLLYRKPNLWQSAFEFWETIVFHTMIVGNAYVFINRLSDGRIHELLIIQPNHVTVTQLDDYSLVYDVTLPNNRFVRLNSSQIWHIRGPSWNGWMGMETVRLVREALGLSIALEESHAAIHKNGTQPGGVYSVEGNLTDEQQGLLVKWLTKYAQDGRGKPLVLDRGAKWFQQQMSGVDAQHIETRRFEIEEICRGVRVIPLMVGQSDKSATYASVEQLLVAHRMHTLGPWGGRLEQSGECQLLTDAELDEGYELRFNMDAHVLSDFKSRQEGFQIQRRNGVINADDWRDAEGRNPRDDPGGQQYIVEANMALQEGGPLPVPVTKPKEPAA
jgi:HK97 family phage portal protein